MAFANLGVSLTANISGFAKKMQTARKRVNGFAKAAKSAGDRARGALTGLGAGAVASLGAMVTKSLAAGDRIQKLAISTGFSTEALSELSHAANLSGTNFEQLVKGMQNMQRAAVEASRGNKEYSDEFDRLGINAAEFLALTPEQQLNVMADAIARLPTAAEQSATAMALMGRAGRDLVPLLAEGGQGIERMRAEAREMGLSLDRLSADKIAAANDAVAKLGAAFQGVGFAFAAEFAQPIAEGAQVLQSALLPVLRGIGNVLATLGQAIGGIAATWGALFSGDFVGAARIAKMTYSDLFSSIKSGAQGVSSALGPLAAPAIGAITGSAAAATGGGLSQQQMSGSFGPAGSAPAGGNQDPQLQDTNSLLQEQNRILGQMGRATGAPATAG